MSEKILVTQKRVLKDFKLQDRFCQTKGHVVLSGIQALVRLPIDQMRADKENGLKTAAFISGYRGSPLGGLDVQLKKNQELLDDHNVKFMPGVNEDLAATAVYGTQIVNFFPHPQFEGVVGYWYGKSPGVDRSGDIFRHANFVGVHDKGGVLVIAGDDPNSKSSTLPSASEITLFDMMMPILYPGTVEEILTLGRFGIELSRYSGLWVGMKVVTDVADAFASVELREVEIKKPTLRSHRQEPTLLPHNSRNLEKTLYGERMEAVLEFIRENRLNSTVIKGNHDTYGIIASGKTFYDLMEALELIGLDTKTLESVGVRIHKLQVIFPLDSNELEHFAKGLQKILIVEEKRGFIEMQVKNLLYDFPNMPEVVGKKDTKGNSLVPAYGELLVGDVIEVLKKFFKETHVEKYFLNIELKEKTLIPLQIADNDLPLRTPYFCSGCPHNRSTNLPEGSIGGGGIGCHGLALMMKKNTIGLLHMGGEGISWVGASPFTQMSHMFQNMGDGTLAHSGYLAIRQAVASKVNITYKVLYNEAVAMTGGQPADGILPLPELTRALEAEGVKKIIVCSHDIKKYPRKARWAKGVKILPREKFEEAQLILREVKGVTVLIYDQPCAADLRRKRKRGEIPTPRQRVFINELVCEGCGDCGVKSNCLSVYPVETEFGRKTRIHQSSCNKDYTCLEGDCPAFVTVEINDEKEGKVHVSDEIFSLKFEEPTIDKEECNIFMVGIGGTGVVTINQILGTATHIDGKYVTNLDQTGLSQKGGTVVSHIKIRKQQKKISNRTPPKMADLLLVFDVVGGLRETTLNFVSSRRTHAVVSVSKIPTGQMVSSKEIRFPEVDIYLKRLEGNVKEVVDIDAQELSDTLFGSSLFANMIMVGMAYQLGKIPLSKEAIFRAIEINGVKVKTNKMAFLVGRLSISDRTGYLNSLLQREKTEFQQIDQSIEQLIEELMVSGELKRIIAIRVQELIGYQNTKWAKNYIEFLKKVKQEEEKLNNSAFPLTESVARYLYKLMTYKDEYEVARLYLKPEFEQALYKQFGKDVKLSYNLHPPFVRMLGRRRKLKFGRWFKQGFKLLYWARFLRGTVFDPFGFTHMRRIERALIEEYKEVIESLLEGLNQDNIDKAVQIAELPDIIRGYEQVKEDTIEKYREELRTLLNS